MRKIFLLFAALLAASVAFADSFLYVDDINLTPEQLGTEIVVPVKASFNAYVSAWQVGIEYPEGVTPTFVEKGEDMYVSYYNARGRQTTGVFTLAQSGDYDSFVATTPAEGYWQDPNGEDPTAWVTYGVVKWAAGNYEEMLLLYLEIAPDFQGGDLTLTTVCSSSYDTRGATVKDIGEQMVEYVRVCHMSTPIPFEPKRGDVNGDGVVNIADVSDLIDYLLNSNATPVSEENADVNGTGNVNIADVSDLIDFLLTGRWFDELETFNVNGVKFTMIEVEGGTFTMGATPE